MATKRTYSKRHGGYIQVKPHRRKKSIQVRGHCRRRPRQKSYARDTSTPF